MLGCKIPKAQQTTKTQAEFISLAFENMQQI